MYAVSQETFDTTILPEVSPMFRRVRVYIQYSDSQRYQLCFAVSEYTFNSTVQRYKWYQLCFAVSQKTIYFAVSEYSFNALRSVSYVSPCQSIPLAPSEVSTMFCRVRVYIEYYRRYQLCIAVSEYTFNTVRYISYFSQCQCVHSILPEVSPTFRRVSVYSQYYQR